MKGKDHVYMCMPMKLTGFLHFVKRDPNIKSPLPFQSDVALHRKSCVAKLNGKRNGEEETQKQLNRFAFSKSQVKRGKGQRVQYDNVTRSNVWSEKQMW
jgi:hypothetical protein